MESCFRDVIEFEEAAGHELTCSPPSFPPAKVVALRRKLIKEEYDETESAFQKIVATTDDDPRRDELIADLADGLADLVYVCVGTAIHFGVDLPAVWKAVQASNVAKFGEGSWRDESGKVRKPEGWRPPDVMGVIKNQEPLKDAFGAESR